MMDNLMQNKEALHKQYKDSSALEIRRLFHKKYSTNKTDYDSWIIENIPFCKGQHVLDIGCGNGRLWDKGKKWLEDLEELVLADNSEGMVTEISSRFQSYASIKGVIADICSLPFPTQKFDIVIANSMLYHVEKLENALSEVFRVLKPDGTFIATTFSKYGLNSYINDSMMKMGLLPPSQKSSVDFTLEDGGKYLRDVFGDVELRRYDDFLEVSKAEDLADYIFSMTSMRSIPLSAREEIIRYFENKKNDEGIIRIPKIYGMFLCRKMYKISRKYGPKFASEIF